MHRVRQTRPQRAYLREEVAHAPVHSPEQETRPLEQEEGRDDRGETREQEQHPASAPGEDRRAVREAGEVSALIGKVKGPDHNSPNDAAEVWCSPSQVELTVYKGADSLSGLIMDGVSRNLDPIAARNLAALLVRASEEAERMAVARMSGHINFDERPLGKPNQ